MEKVVSADIQLIMFVYRVKWIKNIKKYSLKESNLQTL